MMPRLRRLLSADRHRGTAGCGSSSGAAAFQSRGEWWCLPPPPPFRYRARRALSAVSSAAATTTSIEQTHGRGAALTILIPHETYNPWERRAPLTPAHVRRLIQESNGRVAFVVEPSARRVFADAEYQAAGAHVGRYGGGGVPRADVMLGVKRPRRFGGPTHRHAAPATPPTHLFFSHTAKGQPENMALLRECLRHKVQLLDYERIRTSTPTTTTDSSGRNNRNSGSDERRGGTHGPALSSEPSDGGRQFKNSRRLVSFGRYAGIAGVLDALHALGRKLLYRHGASTPLLSFPPAILHDSLDAARESVRRLSERLAQHGGSRHHEPLVVAVTGRGGGVHGGAMEMLQLLPHTVVAVRDLPDLVRQAPDEESLGRIHVVPVDIADVYARRNHNGAAAVAADEVFDRHDFKVHPTDYRSLFAERVAPYAHVIVNCAYWDARYPRLLSKRQMRRLRQNGNDRLLLVADISCDVHGSIEFLERTTTVESPSFEYDPIAEKETGNLVSGISVLGVDILPAELPRESSAHFGEALLGVVRELLYAKEHQKEGTRGIDVTLLSSGLADACITTTDGSLSPGFDYLRTLMNQAKKGTPVAQEAMTLSFEGHLFDSGLINQVLDVIEHNRGVVEFKECIFPPQSGRASSKSHVVLKIDSAEEKDLCLIEQKIYSLVVDLKETADARVVRLEQNGEAVHASRAYVEVRKREKKVLLLGAGRVSRSFVEYLGRSDDVVITVASDKDDEARDAASAAKHGNYVKLNVADDALRLSALIEDSDLVVSLLPAPMHPPVAMECIAHGADLVTASYESEEMRALNERARNADIVILNEVGLDPGLDHMSAMKIIDEIKARGGTVTGFSSVCGGLPSPEAADNPLKYKFSWSPRGVIRASQNDARYRRDGIVIVVQANELLQSAAPFLDDWHNLELECLPNRDSLIYETIYGIQDVPTLFRGTLRYRGFSSLMRAFQNMGLFDSSVTLATTWSGHFNDLRSRRGRFDTVRDFVVSACDAENPEAADRVLSAIEWLGMLGMNSTAISSTSVVVAFCEALEAKLVYEDGERDMVLMHHTIDAAFEDGSAERHVSSLQCYGDASMSAMSKTVGFTAAASAELVLGGSLKERGLLLPTNRDVYLPLLKSLAHEGIVFDENVVIRVP